MVLHRGCHSLLVYHLVLSLEYTRIGRGLYRKPDRRGCLWNYRESEISHFTSIWGHFLGGDQLCHYSGSRSFLIEENGEVLVCVLGIKNERRGRQRYHRSKVKSQKLGHNLTVLLLTNYKLHSLTISYYLTSFYKHTYKGFLSNLSLLLKHRQMLFIGIWTL